MDALLAHLARQGLSQLPDRRSTCSISSVIGVTAERTECAGKYDSLLQLALQFLCHYANASCVQTESKETYPFLFSSLSETLLTMIRKETLE